MCPVNIGGVFLWPIWSRFIHYAIKPIGIESIISPLKETKEHPMGGSTDVGDVSFVVPTIRLSATTAPKGTPWHSWAVVACGGLSVIREWSMRPKRSQ